MFKSYPAEIASAFQGVARLLFGRRDAVNNFDLSTRGLMGALVIVAISLAINAYHPYLISPGGSVSASSVVFAGIIQLMGQYAGAFIALRIFDRTDGFVPFVICDSWASFFITMIVVALTLTGVLNFAITAILVISAFIISVNVARVVVTLDGWRVVGFIFAQVLGTFFAILPVLSLIAPEVVTG